MLCCQRLLVYYSNCDRAKESNETSSHSGIKNLLEALGAVQLPFGLT
jgi:hypothetical protein